MNREDYVSFECAKLLKEKGFNIPCIMYYTSNGEIEDTKVQMNHNYGSDISRPTLYEAQKWLREKFCIHVNTFPIYDKAYEVVDYKVRITTYDDLLGGKKGKLLSPPIWFKKYEQVLNEGIKEALKLI